MSLITFGTELHQAIRTIMLSNKILAFDKRREVATLVIEELETFGKFCRTEDNRFFFFSDIERRLYDLEQRPFQHLLTSISGLSVTEGAFAFLHDIVQVHTARTAQVVQVHTLAFYDSQPGFLAISDGGGGVWLRERRGKWIFAHNGDENLLFLTEPDATPWQPDFRTKEKALAWFLQGFLFAEGMMTREEQRRLIAVFLYQQFFPALRRTRVIPACLGPQGSGKTSALRRTGHLFVGPKFEVTGLHRDREDAFVAAVTNRTVCALDNADSRIPWLADALATYATGHRYRLRKLYTTNEEVSYDPRAVLMISSRDPQFNRPDVAERLLPLYFERPEKYEPEERLFHELEAKRPAIWGRLLLALADIADGLPETDAPALPHRMADFATFGWKVYEQRGRASQWLSLLHNLDRVQAAFASEGDGVVEALRILLDKNDGKIDPVPVADLFKECRDLADDEGFPFPRTAQGFSRRLTLLRRVLELELGVRMREDRGHARKRRVSFVPVKAETKET